jgi:hypothetical protein
MANSAPRTVGEAIDADLERAINEIVKLGDRDEAVVAGEIRDYIVTPDLERHYSAILGRFAKHMAGGDEQKVGLWVSGYYGSGKSSFAKILSYIIENQTLAGSSAADLFHDRTSGAPALRKALKAINDLRPVVIRFDMQGDRDLAGLDNEMFTLIADRALRRALKISESLRLAELEIRLEEEAELAAFTAHYDRVFGAGAWARQKHKEEPGLDNASRILHEIDPKTYPTADTWSASEKQAVFSANKFPARAARMIDRWCGPNRPFVFVADEVGHHVGRSGDRMRDLQGFVEALGRDLHGRAWVVVTAQERLDETWRATGSERSELPHLLDRFEPVDLAPKDIGEVTQKRLLRKTAAGRAALEAKFQENQEPLRAYTELERAAAFATSEHLVHLGKVNFVDYYPFLPYQVDLVMKIVTGIRDRGGAHRLAGGAARTLIRLVQDILTKRDDIRLADKPVGTLATLDLVYDQQAANLPSERRTDLDTVVAAFANDQMAIRVAKALCVLEYADTQAGSGSPGPTTETRMALVPRTIQNIAAVLHPHVDAPSQKADVEAALKRLEEKGKIRRTANAGFELLTPAAQRWEQERAQLRPTAEDRLEELRAAFRHLLDDISSWKHPHGRKFTSDWILGGRSLFPGSKDLRIELRYFTGMKERTTTVQAAEAATRADGTLAIWVVPDFDDLDALADDMLRARRMVARYQNQRGSAYDRLIMDETARAEECVRVLRAKAQAALVSGTLVHTGQPHLVANDLGRTLDEAVRVALALLQKSLFPDYERAALSVDDHQIKTVLESPLDALPQFLHAGQEGIGLLSREGKRVVVDRSSFLADKMLTVLGTGRRGQEIDQLFRKPPYGWTEDTVRLILAVLLRGGFIQVTHRGRVLTAATETGTTEPFLQRGPFTAAVFARRDDGLDNAKRVAAARALSRMLGERISEDEQEIHRSLGRLAERERDRLVALEARLRSVQLPGAERVQTARESLATLASATAVEATRALAAQGDTLADSIEWSAKLQGATTEDALRRLAEARQALGFLWPALMEDGASEDLTGEAGRLGEFLEGDGVFERIADLAGPTARIIAAHGKRVQELLAERNRLYHDAVEVVKARPAFDELARRDSARAEALLAPLANLTTSAPGADGRSSLRELRAEVLAVEGMLRRTLADLEKAVAPADAAPEVIQVRRFVSGAISDEAELNKRIEDLRDACLRALRRGRPIVWE